MFSMSDPKTIDEYAASVKAAIREKDARQLLQYAEALMLWHQSDSDSDKMEAAGILDDIADFLMNSKEFGSARMVIIGSLRLKGTLDNQSGMTTFSYEQLEQCERAVGAAAGESTALQGRRAGAQFSGAMLIVALLAVASVWGVCFLLVK